MCFHFVRVNGGLSKPGLETLTLRLTSKPRVPWRGRQWWGSLRLRSRSLLWSTVKVWWCSLLLQRRAEYLPREKPSGCTMLCLLRDKHLDVLQSLASCQEDTANFMQEWHRLSKWFSQHFVKPGSLTWSYLLCNYVIMLSNSTPLMSGRNAVHAFSFGGRKQWICFQHFSTTCNWSHMSRSTRYWMLGYNLRSLMSAWCGLER